MINEKNSWKQVDYDPFYLDFYCHMMKKFSWGTEHYKEINFVSVIAATNGWLPLEKNEKMTTKGENGEVYLIKRIK